MSTINDGGAAFPVAGTAGSSVNVGMTLRDYFAAKAMQGLNAKSDPRMLTMSVDRISSMAYQQADAMIAARGEA